MAEEKVCARPSIISFPGVERVPCTAAPRVDLPSLNIQAMPLLPIPWPASQTESKKHLVKVVDSLMDEEHEKSAIEVGLPGIALFDGFPGVSLFSFCELFRSLSPVFPRPSAVHRWIR